MTTKKNDAEQLDGILAQFDAADIVTSVKRLGLSRMFAQSINLVPFVTMTAAQETPIEDLCNSEEAVKSINKPPSNVGVNVNNTGDCPVTVKLTAGGKEKGSVTVPRNKSGSITTSPVDQVVISCDDSDVQDPECRFTYSINWS